MFDAKNLNEVIGSTAYDSSGDKVGSVDQIYLDDSTDQPSWVSVNTGLFGMSQSMAPLQGARFDNGELHLACSKDQVKDAPRVEADQHLSSSEEDELFRHYGVAPGSAAGMGGPAEVGGTDTDPDRDADLGQDRAGDLSEEASVTRSEERLNVDTEQVETGRARLRKYVTTEEETVTVPVRQERLEVQREPVGERSGGTIDDTGEEVEEVVLREERPVVDKETVDVERVSLGKESVTDEESVTEEVRKEQVEVEGDDVTDRGDRR